MYPLTLLADLRPGGGMGQVEVDSNGNLVEGRGVAEQLADWLHRAHKTLDFVCDLSQPERREDGNMSSSVNNKYLIFAPLLSTLCRVSDISILLVLSIPELSVVSALQGPAPLKICDPYGYIHEPPLCNKYTKTTH